MCDHVSHSAVSPLAFYPSTAYPSSVTARDEPRALTLESPTLREAYNTIERGFARGALVTLFGRCTVEYDGRAASQLAAGDRHVMFKPDGAALVHTAEGQKPVNWQPPGCEHRLEVDAKTLCLESHRSNPTETLRIVFDRLDQVSVFAMTEPDELAVIGTEADLRERLVAEPDLLETGFQPLSTERQTAAGAIDLYGEDREGRTVVVELKRRRVGPDAVSQLRRYVEAIRTELHADATVRGILVAPSVTDRATRLLERHGLEFVALEP